MSVLAQFAATPRLAVGQVSTANTNRDGTGTIVTVLSAGTNGTLLTRIVVKAEGDPADSIVTIFLHDGTNARLFDEFDLGNPAAANTTTPGYREERVYDDLVLPSGWSIRAAITVAPSSGVVDVWAIAADL